MSLPAANEGSRIAIAQNREVKVKLIVQLGEKCGCGWIIYFGPSLHMVIARWLSGRQVRNIYVQHLQMWQAVREVSSIVRGWCGIVGRNGR